MDKKLQIDKYLHKIDYTFRYTGMHLRSRENYNVTKARILYCFNFVSFNTDVCGAAAWFILGISRGESLTSLTYIAPCIAFGSLGNFKSISSLVYANTVDEMIDKLRKLELNVNLDKNKNLEIEKLFKFLDRVLKWLQVFYWILIIGFPAIPLAVNVYNYFEDKDEELLLPFLVEYPFDAHDIRFWPFALIKQIWSDMLVVFATYGTDSLYYICTIHILVQFKLLQREIKNIVPENNLINGQDYDQEIFRQKLSELVQWHEELFVIVQLLERAYSKCTLFNFLVSSAMICLTGFNVTAIDDFAFVLSFMTFLFMSIMQIYFLCYFGDMLMRSSIEVSDAVYNCNWYLANARIAKDLHFLQMRAQKPCKLTAYGFADVNMRAFSKVLNTAWSYFALLKTVTRSRV